MTNFGSITQQTVDFINSYWDMQLGSTPNVTNAAGLTYDSDPATLPAILAPGGFASSTAGYVSTFQSGLYGALASACINALCNGDKAFLVQLFLVKATARLVRSILG